MKVLRYKKKAKDKYLIILDDNREFVFYEDVILKYDLLLKKEIDEYVISLAEDFNLECDVYYVALNIINARTRSIYELKELLLKRDYSLGLIDKAISKLIEQGYLDDRMFTKNYIHNQMITTSKGPLKIKNDLLNKKVDIEIINEEIVCFTIEEQTSKIRKIINKTMNSNRSKSGLFLKKKIVSNLLNLGYDDFLITDIVNAYSFKDDKTIEKHEYEKLYKKYSKSYTGEELRKKIFDKMYQKGFNYEEK